MRACQITEGAYDPRQLEAYYHEVLQKAATDQPQYYEIQIDGRTVIPKTADPQRFWDFSEYVTGHSRQIALLMYFSEHSKATDKHFFGLKESPRTDTTTQASLNGISGAPVLDAAALREQWDKERYVQELEEENEDLKEEIEGLNQVIVQLDAEREQLQNGWQGQIFKGLGTVNTILSDTRIGKKVGSFIKNLEGDDLSGTEEETSKSSFKRKSTVQSEPMDVESEEVQQEPLSELDQKYLATLYEIKDRVGSINMKKVFEVIDLVTAHPHSIPFAIKQINNFLRQRPTSTTVENNPESKDPLSEVPHF